MRLKPDAKLNKNLKLLHSCSQVRCIELTESLSLLNKKQLELIESSPKLRTFLTGVYKENFKNEGITIDNPSLENLLTTDLSDYDNFEPDEEFAEVFKQYLYSYNKINRLQKTFDEHQELNELLDQRIIPIKEVNRFLIKTAHSSAFQDFADKVEDTPAIILSLYFKRRANAIAERNGIANSIFYSKSNKAFSSEDVALKLKKDFTGRLLNKGIKFTAALALSATLLGVGFNWGKNSVKTTQGITNPHTTEAPTTEKITHPIQDPEGETLNIFTNSVTNINSYETACDAYFEAISDVYEYNTGKEIDLSDYKQKQIGMNESTKILTVEYNGQIYRFSGQSQIDSNYKHLKEAFDELGANYTETNSRILYIVDKDNSNQSIAIVDNQGNPVRSGNVITGNNRAYNQEYVKEGRAILTAQGKDSSSLSEAECVAAYILSDKYNIQDPDLSIAQGEFANSTYTIKTTFYENKNGKSDPYAVQEFTTDLKEDKNAFKQSVLEKNQNTQTKSEAEKTRDDDR